MIRKSTCIEGGLDKFYFHVIVCLPHEKYKLNWTNMCDELDLESIDF